MCSSRAAYILCSLQIPSSRSIDEDAWDGNAYPLKGRYLDGEDLIQAFPHWDVTQPDGSQVRLPSPHEFRHTLSTVLNTLVGNGFTFLGLWEYKQREENPAPGTWPHFTQFAPPSFDSFWRLER